MDRSIDLAVQLMQMMSMMILQVMEGNSNTYLAAKQELTPVIIASKVMINMMNMKVGL